MRTIFKAIVDFLIWATCCAWSSRYSFDGGYACLRCGRFHIRE